MGDNHAKAILSARVSTEAYMSAWSGVVVVAIALAVALVAVGQPTWQWHRSTGNDWDTWSYTLFGATHTVYNGTTNTTSVAAFSYVNLPGQPNVASFYQLLQYAFAGMLACAIAAAGLSVATARRRLRGMFAGIAMVAGGLLALVIPLDMALNLTTAAAADLPRLNGAPIPGFQGQMTLPQSGASAIVVVWGPALAWYLLLVLALVFVFGATEIWSVRPARKPAARVVIVSTAQKVPPPPEQPPAPPRQEPTLEEVFVIGSNGLLIKHMSRTLMSEKDRDVVGGMISVLSNFVRETFSERNGNDVQEITLGDHRFVLCSDSGIVVAVLVTRGATDDIVPRQRHLIALLVDRYGGKLEEWDGQPLEGIEDEIAVLWQPFFLPPPPVD